MKLSELTSRNWGDLCAALRVGLSAPAPTLPEDDLGGYADWSLLLGGIETENKPANLGGGESMREVYRLLDYSVDRSNRVLFQGGKEVGKERMARLLHMRGPRRHAPFHTVHCSHSTSEVLAEDLFGCKSEGKPSIFARSQGGTVHLEDIHALSLSLQARLVHLLESGIDSGCRLICSSSLNLHEGLGAQTFLPELYYLISAVTITLPDQKNKMKDANTLIEEL